MGNSTSNERENNKYSSNKSNKNLNKPKNNEIILKNTFSIPKGSFSDESTKYLNSLEKTLFYFSSGSNISGLRTILIQNISINTLDEERTSPLHIACRSASLDMVEEIINSGGNIDITDLAGWTPLHVACYFKRASCIFLLLKHKASLLTRNREGVCPFDLIQEDKVCVELISEYINQTNIINSYMENRLKEIIEINDDMKQSIEFNNLLKTNMRKNEINNLNDNEVLSILSHLNSLYKEIPKENVFSIKYKNQIIYSQIDKLKNNNKSVNCYENLDSYIGNEKKEGFDIRNTSMFKLISPNENINLSHRVNIVSNSKIKLEEDNKTDSSTEYEINDLMTIIKTEYSDLSTIYNDYNYSYSNNNDNITFINQNKIIIKSLLDNIYTNHIDNLCDKNENDDDDKTNSLNDTIILHEVNFYEDTNNILKVLENLNNSEKNILSDEYLLKDRLFLTFESENFLKTRRLSSIIKKSKSSIENIILACISLSSSFGLLIFCGLMNIPNTIIEFIKAIREIDLFELINKIIFVESMYWKEDNMNLNLIKSYYSENYITNQIKSKSYEEIRDNIIGNKDNSQIKKMENSEKQNNKEVFINIPTHNRKYIPNECSSSKSFLSSSNLNEIKYIYINNDFYKEIFDNIYSSSLGNIKYIRKYEYMKNSISDLSSKDKILIQKEKLFKRNQFLEWYFSSFINKSNTLPVYIYNIISCNGIFSKEDILDNDGLLLKIDIISLSISTCLLSVYYKESISNKNYNVLLSQVKEFTGENELYSFCFSFIYLIVSIYKLIQNSNKDADVNKEISKKKLDFLITTKGFLNDTNQKETSLNCLIKEVFFLIDKKVSLSFSDFIPFNKSCFEEGYLKVMVKLFLTKDDFLQKENILFINSQITSLFEYSELFSFNLSNERLNLERVIVNSLINKKNYENSKEEKSSKLKFKGEDFIYVFKNEISYIGIEKYIMIEFDFYSLEKKNLYLRIMNNSG